MNQGCDASILLDVPNSEKTAVQNTGIFGYDLIDDIKAELEAECPGVVSCADIIVAATRDAIGMVGKHSLSRITDSPCMLFSLLRLHLL